MTFPIPYAIGGLVAGPAEPPGPYPTTPRVEPDPVAKGFNYGTGWPKKTIPYPAIYLKLERVADELRRKAKRAEQASWALDMALRNVRLAHTEDRAQTALDILATMALENTAVREACHIDKNTALTVRPGDEWSPGDDAGIVQWAEPVTTIGFDIHVKPDAAKSLEMQEATPDDGVPVWAIYYRSDFRNGRGAGPATWIVDYPYNPTGLVKARGLLKALGIAWNVPTTDYTE